MWALHEFRHLCGNQKCSTKKFTWTTVWLLHAQTVTQQIWERGIFWQNPERSLFHPSRNPTAVPKRKQTALIFCVLKYTVTCKFVYICSQYDSFLSGFMTSQAILSVKQQKDDLYVIFALGLLGRELQVFLQDTSSRNWESNSIFLRRTKIGLVVAYILNILIRTRSFNMLKLAPWGYRFITWTSPTTNWFMNWSRS